MAVYLYNICSKCGRDKPRNRKSKCKGCRPTPRKRYYDVCSKCKSPKSLTRSSYCNECQKPYRKPYVPKKPIDRKGMIEFVKLINSRGGFCSAKEIFVDLIGYYNQIIKMDDGIDNLYVKDQIVFMWDRVQQYSKTGKK